MFIIPLHFLSFHSEDNYEKMLFNSCLTRRNCAARNDRQSNSKWKGVDGVEGGKFYSYKNTPFELICIKILDRRKKNIFSSSLWRWRDEKGTSITQLLSLNKAERTLRIRFWLINENHRHNRNLNFCVEGEKNICIFSRHHNDDDNLLPTVINFITQKRHSIRLSSNSMEFCVEFPSVCLSSE